jgi:ribosomal protein S27E
MSQKMTCPACASYTTAITTARDNGEPCPYCGADLLTGRKTATSLTDLSDDFPFVRPEGSEADMFIQWKGTEVCMDFRCPCGAEGHVDASFAYYVRCHGCGAIYEMGTQVIARRVAEANGAVVDTEP